MCKVIIALLWVYCSSNSIFSVDCLQHPAARKMLWATNHPHCKCKLMLMIAQEQAYHQPTSLVSLALTTSWPSPRPVPLSLMTNYQNLLPVPPALTESYQTQTHALVVWKRLCFMVAESEHHPGLTHLQLLVEWDENRWTK